MSTRIKDIAEQANVSIATVSLVLNNKPGVGDATRQRVLQLAQEMNYGHSGVPAGLEAAYRARSTSGEPAEQGTIRFLKIARHGHTVNRDHTVFISDYIDGIVQGAKANNYKIEITSFNTTNIEEIVQSISDEKDLSGAVILGTELSRDDVMAFRDPPIPLVFLDTFLDFIPFDFVDMNNQDSVHKVVQHFVAHGHREIGMVASDAETRNFQLREDGFRNTMNFLGLPLQEHYIFYCDSTFEGAYRDMHAIIENGAKLPTALFCSNDIIAFGVLKAIREAGLGVPEDVSVVGFDDLPTAALMDPPLTTIAVSKREIGLTAINRLTRRIQAPDMPSVKIVIGGTLVERASVKEIDFA